MIMARSGSTQKEKGWFRVNPDASSQHATGGESTVGGPCRKVEVEEVDLCPVDNPKDPDA